MSKMHFTIHVGLSVMAALVAGCAIDPGGDEDAVPDEHTAGLASQSMNGSVYPLANSPGSPGQYRHANLRSDLTYYDPTGKSIAGGTTNYADFMLIELRGDLRTVKLPDLRIKVDYGDNGASADTIKFGSGDFGWSAGKVTTGHNAAPTGGVSGWKASANKFGRLYKHIAECALNPGQTATLTVVDATVGLHPQNPAHLAAYPTLTFTGTGVFGLATSWATGALNDVSQQRWLSACLLARTNRYGFPIRISMRHPTKANLQADATTKSEFPFFEGAYWGNVFLDEVANGKTHSIAHHCVANYPDAQKNTRDQLLNGVARECSNDRCDGLYNMGGCFDGTAYNSPQVPICGQTKGQPFKIHGDGTGAPTLYFDANKNGAPDAGEPANTQGMNACWDSGIQYNEVISVFVDATAPDNNGFSLNQARMFPRSPKVAINTTQDEWRCTGNSGLTGINTKDPWGGQGKDVNAAVCKIQDDLYPSTGGKAFIALPGGAGQAARRPGISRTWDWDSGKRSIECADDEIVDAVRVDHASGDILGLVCRKANVRADRCRTKLTGGTIRDTYVSGNWVPRDVPLGGQAIECSLEEHVTAVAVDNASRNIEAILCCVD